MSYVVCKFPSYFLTLQTHQPVKPTFSPQSSKLWALRPIGVGRGQNGIPWQEITSSANCLTDMVVFVPQKCGDSNSNRADVGNKDKKPWKIQLLFWVLDLIVWDMETGTMWVSRSVFHDHFRILTPMIPLFTLRTAVNPKKTTSKKGTIQQCGFQKKHRFHQES